MESTEVHGVARGRTYFGENHSFLLCEWALCVSWISGTVCVISRVEGESCLEATVLSDLTAPSRAGCSLTDTDIRVQ